MKTALITGVTGQGGSYLSNILSAKGYTVLGTTRDIRSANLNGLEYLGVQSQVKLIQMDVCNTTEVREIVERWQPDEIYNLAAPSSVAMSFKTPVPITESIVSGNLNLLEAIRHLGKEVRFIEASSSEMFGNCEQPANEQTIPDPYSPYGVAKTATFHQTRNYRESYGIHANAAIFFNFESPLRPSTFVTRKIIRGVCDIIQGEADSLHLGDLSVARDWGWAPEYMNAAWEMLQQKQPRDLVLATGTVHSLRDFVRLSFEAVGLDYTRHVVINNQLYRPKELVRSVGDPTAAEETIGWKAETLLPEIVARMMQEELQLSSEGSTDGAGRTLAH